jgi:quinoprotein dehydrogenase-associated probable ABC transporter substrate-binding protein
VDVTGRSPQSIASRLRGARSPGPARNRARPRLGLDAWSAAHLLALILLAHSVPLLAGPADEPAGVLRVCQDPNNLPFSNTRGEGFENRIAELFAAKLGWKLEYFSFPQRMGFIRNTLRFKLPGEGYRCDLVVGVPEGYDQVSPTRPYYRSTYALVYPKGSALDGVRGAAELLALPADALAKLRIGVFDRSPASDWLARHGLIERAVPYRLLNADPDYYPGEIIEKDLASGKLDAAVVWGPIAGFFARRVTSPQLAVVPLPSEPGVKFDYGIAMGVRYGEPEWKATVGRLIAENAAALEAILRDYGVPLVDEKGALRP